MPEALLTIKELKTYFPVYSGLFFQRIKNTVKAVDGITLNLNKGDVLGLVGESGCGKSTLGRSIMQIEHITYGSIAFDGHVLNHLPEKLLNKIRPNFQMIFQDPYASLNPRMTVFETLSEPLVYHGIEKKSDVLKKIMALMTEVGIEPRYMKKYPHEFSGGQRQRIAIARALTVNPKLIIADEPVSALDVSIQSQILNLLAGLIQKYALTMIFISHDLSVIQYITNKTAVMYLGKIVEMGTTQDLFSHPLHPYTQALFSAIPLPNPDQDKKRIILSGEPPSPINPPAGCRFHTRCPKAKEHCKTEIPELNSVSGHADDHLSACHYPLLL